MKTNTLKSALATIVTDIEQIKSYILSWIKEYEEKPVDVFCTKELNKEALSNAIITITDRLRLCGYDREAKEINIACNRLLKENVGYRRGTVPPLSAALLLEKSTRDSVQRLLNILTDVQDILEAERASKQKKNGDNEAYIPYKKAIELSNGILTRRKLDKAIQQSEPVKVRSKKPRKNRRTVHIQDVMLLINKLSATEKVAKEAARMFGEYKEQHQKKITGKMNLD